MPTPSPSTSHHTPCSAPVAGSGVAGPIQSDAAPPSASATATGMPIKTIRRYAQLVSAGRSDEQQRLALLETHRAEVAARLAEIQDNLELIDHKIDVYRGRLAAGDADQLWAPDRQAGAR